jgi:hypothetical protein
MAVLAIEDYRKEGSRVTVTALVEDMRLLYHASYHGPDEWCPALCSTSFELDETESIPTDEIGFCCYLTERDLDWELVDTSDCDFE